MSNPVCVVAGDIHYSMKNLELADKSTKMAIAKANALRVPFVANGDTSDTKAILRAECVNAMIEAFKTAQIRPYVNVGNHCRINAKSVEHSLNFLKPYAEVIDTPRYVEKLGSWVIPYHDNKEELMHVLSYLAEGQRLIAHQGVVGGLMGEYIKDDSALPATVLAPFRTILSHYHNRHDIQCGPTQSGLVGVASFVGAPYTMSWGEANDPPKGFQILYDDGSLEFVPTNLRKHAIVELEWSKTPIKPLGIKPDDLVWIKISGTREQLAYVDKENTAGEFKYRGNELPENFKLDLIPLESETAISTQVNQSQPEILDGLIDSLTNTSDEQKTRVKNLWRGM